MRLRGAKRGLRASSSTTRGSKLKQRTRRSGRSVSERRSTGRRAQGMVSKSNTQPRSSQTELLQVDDDVVVDFGEGDYQYEPRVQRWAAPTLITTLDRLQIVEFTGDDNDMLLEPEAMPVATVKPRSIGDCKFAWFDAKIPKRQLRLLDESRVASVYESHAIIETDSSLKWQTVEVSPTVLRKVVSFNDEFSSMFP